MPTAGPDFLFFKQTAQIPSYFVELCLDVTGSGTAVVFSDICQEPIGGVRFLAGPRYVRDTAGQRLLTWAKYTMAAFWTAFRTPGKPMLFIVAQPPFLPLLGYVQKKLAGRHYVLWIDDVWPDVIVSQGLRSESSWVIQMWQAFNRLTYRHADHVFTLGPCMRQRVLRYVPPQVEVSIVPTWVDTKLIRPLPKQENPFAREHGQVGKITAMYSGNLGATHDIQSILEAARRLRHRKDAEFMIIGEGPQWNDVRDSIQANQDPNIILLPFQPAEVLPLSLATAEIALVSQDRRTAGISMPSKAYYALAAGAALAALCPEESDLAYLVRENECGIRVEPGDPEGLAAGIGMLLDSQTRLHALRQNARRAAVEKFSREVNTARLRSLLRGDPAACDSDRQLKGDGA